MLWPRTPQGGEAEDTGAGLAALPGADLWAGAEHAQGPSEPSFSFLSCPRGSVQSACGPFIPHCGCLLPAARCATMHPVSHLC